MKFFPLIIFTTALIFRVWNLGETSIYPDEITWMVRGKETFYAITKGNFEYFKTAWWNDKGGQESIGLPLSLASGTSLSLLGQNQSRFSLNLFKDYVAARFPIAVISSIFIVAFYFCSSKLVSKNVAFLAALLLCLDPTHISLSRWVMNDSLLTTTTFLAVFYFSQGIQLQKLRPYLYGSIFLALSFLTKPQGLIAAMPVLTSLIPNFYTKRNLRFAFFSAAIFFLIIFMLWPQMWFGSFLSIWDYLWRQVSTTSQGLPYYFWGEVTSNPSKLYYIFQIFTKLPITIIIGLAIYLIALIKRRVNIEKEHILIGTFFIVFLVLISLAPLKIGVRYALPLWPWIYLISASGLVLLINTMKDQKLKYVLASAFILMSATESIRFSPDLSIYYNQLVGGPKGAQKVDIVSLCLGVKESLEYIKSCHPNIKSVAILGCSNVTAPYYFKGKITTDWDKEEIVVVESSFAQILPNNNGVVYFKSQEPDFVATLNGATLAKVYKNNPKYENSCKGK